MIYVGSILGGTNPSTERVNDFISELSYAVEDLQLGGQYDCEIDIVFHIPGPITGPGYEGLRSGSLSRSQRTMQVQVAVPDQAWDARDLRVFLRRSLVEALEIAQERIRADRLDWDTTAFTDVVSRAVIRPDDAWDTDPMV